MDTRRCSARATCIYSSIQISGQGHVPINININSSARQLISTSHTSYTLLRCALHNVFSTKPDNNKITQIAHSCMILLFRLLCAFAKPYLQSYRLHRWPTHGHKGLCTSTQAIQGGWSTWHLPPRRLRSNFTLVLTIMFSPILVVPSVVSRQNQKQVWYAQIPVFVP